MEVTHFVEYKKARQIYEFQIEEKNRKPGTAVTATSYLASFEDSYLCLFIAAGWITAETVSDISEEQLKECIEKRSVQSFQEHELSKMEDAITDLKMDMKISDAESRVWFIYQR